MIDHRFIVTQFINAVPRAVASAEVPRVRECIRALHLIGIDPRCITRARFLVNNYVIYEVCDGRDGETGERVPACEVAGHGRMSPEPALVIPLAFWPAAGIFVRDAQWARVEAWLNESAPTDGRMQLLSVFAL